MSSLFVPADPAGARSFSDQQPCVEGPQQFTLGARALPVRGRLDVLPRFTAARSGEIVDCEARSAPQHLHRPETGFVMKETIDYRELLRSVTQHGAEPGEGMIEAFQTVVRVVRALMNEQDGKPVQTEQREQCAVLLRAVGSWVKQPPEVMHANIDRALTECPLLPQDAREMLLRAVVSWDLSSLPEATQADDYYRLDRTIYGLTGTAKFELSGRLSVPVRDFPTDKRWQSWEGISRLTLHIPPLERTAHSPQMAPKAICQSSALPDKTE